jgi:hypothetical protein
MTTPSDQKGKPLFLDTTVMVESAVGTDKRRNEIIDELKAEFPQLLACEFSRLEFKRVVIQNLTCLLNYILENEPPSFCAAVAKASRVRTRKSNTLENILAWVGMQANTKLDLTEDDTPDQLLALQSISYIRNAVMALWYGFESDLLSVGDRLNCQRAKEAPRRKATGSIDDTIHESQCRTRQCHNANFFQEQRTTFLKIADSLKALRENGVELPAELTNAENAIRAAATNHTRLYDYDKCLELSDVWIHLECLVAGSKDFATFNYKESQHLCPLLGLTMRPQKS